MERDKRLPDGSFCLPSSPLKAQWKWERFSLNPGGDRRDSRSHLSFTYLSAGRFISRKPLSSFTPSSAQHGFTGTLRGGRWGGGGVGGGMTNLMLLCKYIAGECGFIYLFFFFLPPFCSSVCALNLCGSGGELPAHWQLDRRAGGKMCFLVLFPGRQRCREEASRLLKLR